MPTKLKKLKKTKKVKKPTHRITFNEFSDMMLGFTDEEFNLVSDWLSNLRKKP